MLPPYQMLQGHSTALVDAAFASKQALAFRNRIGDSRYPYYHWSQAWQNRHGNPYPIRVVWGLVSFTTIIALVLGRRVGLKNRVLFI